MQCQKRIEKYQFNLKKLLGQGSYASVYRGKVIDTGEPVAVKVIDKRIFTSKFNLKNLHCEIDIMKKVSHNSIVQLHDVYQTTNNMYIITELCDCDLYHLLKMRRKLTEIEAVTYLRQIMQGAKYLNAQNVIHRDLKPANILLKDNQCKISDFGFARNMEQGEQMLRSIVGTPLYMSPQLLQKQKYSNKSDLWSIGLIFYEMLHGRTPWQANNELQLINAIYTHKITYSKLISELARNFIARCLAIQEDKRITWEQAFEHPLITEEKENVQKGVSTSTIFYQTVKEKEMSKLFEGKTEIENNSMILNFNQLKRTEKNKERCLTPKTQKGTSQIKLKKVEALTPKSGFGNISNRLKQVVAQTNCEVKKTDDPSGPERRRRDLTIVSPRHIPKS